jgi:hypothetical protein
MILYKLILAAVLSVSIVSAQLTQVVVHASIFSEPAISYCKCVSRSSQLTPGICFTNSTIIPLHRPADASKPCLSCTKQWCLEQRLSICEGAELPELDKDVGTGNEGDVEARCFSESDVDDASTDPRTRFSS